MQQTAVHLKKELSVLACKRKIRSRIVTSKLETIVSIGVEG